MCHWAMQGLRLVAMHRGPAEGERRPTRYPAFVSTEQDTYPLALPHFRSIHWLPCFSEEIQPASYAASPAPSRERRSGEPQRQRCS